jgi:hypothetical protein
MSEKDYQKVPNWKIILVLMIIVWLANILMSFVYRTQPSFFMFNWLTNIFLSLVETILFAVLFYIFYLLFWKNKDKNTDNN